MSDAPAEEIDAPTINSMAAFSNQLQELTNSLNLLYIRNNASGRNKFRHKWPDVALFILGEQLIKFDNEGVINIEDRERRSELETEAGERRIQLKQTISEIIDKSVDQGSLLFDYVGGIIDIYGGGISRFLYAEDVIERVRPGLLASCVTVQDADDAKKAADDAVRDELISKNAAALNDSTTNQGHKMPLEDQKLSVEEQSILSNISAESSSGDTLDDIKPIETEAPARTLNNPVPEALQAVKPPVAPVQDVATPEPEATPTQDKLEEKQEEEKAAPLSPPSMSEALDSIKPIDTGSVADEAPKKELPPEPPKEVVEEQVAVEAVKEDVPTPPPVEEKKPIEDAVSDSVKEESVPEPVIEEPSTETPKTETIEDKPTSEKPVSSVEKGTYVALFNGLAQVV